MKCKVPFKLFEFDITKSLSEALILRYYEKKLYPNDNLYPIDITPWITKKLIPENIISYSDPKNIDCYVKNECGYF